MAHLINGRSIVHRVSAGSGSAMSSARVTVDNAAQQLGIQRGYTFNGDAIWDWDDAGYVQTYGSRAGGNLDSPATIMVVPVAGRYLFTVHGEFNVVIGQSVSTTPRAFIFAEKDTADSDEAFYESKIAKPDYTQPGGSWDATWAGTLDVGGCVGIFSSNAVNAGNDLLNGFMSIVFLGPLSGDEG